MAVRCKAGRPYHVADISFSNDPDTELYEKFYAACRNLSYFEMAVLARALKVDARTVRRWRSGRYFPSRRGLAILVIRWVDRGKPQRTITQAELASGAI